MKISSPSRNTSVRKPSHFGSKIHPSPGGNSPTRLASIGSTGGLTTRCTQGFSFLLGTLYKNPVYCISSHVWSPHFTSFVASGLLLFDAELSYHAVAVILPPAG